MKTLRAALLLIALLAPAAAHATHDIGQGYHLLRVADSGAALLAACDVQVSEPPILRVISRTGRVMKTLQAPWDDTGDVLCGDPAKLAPVFAEHPELAEAIARYDLEHVPVTSETSPDGRHHVFWAIDYLRAEVELLSAGRSRPVKTDRLRAKAGISSIHFGFYVAWHPDGRFGYLVGQRASGVVPSCQVWEPVVRVFRTPKTKAEPLDPERIADRYLRWAAVRTKRCERRNDVDACSAADTMIRRAMRLAPGYAPAQSALDGIPWP